ncbi:unnamed protein product [Mytilus edulis]|uniref:Mitochondria-eating protein C-terminal domain-containing protein n=1 Tax=Mytilus edulis TaxID=6550 RepID=A0A8S3R3E7_MYTED|nr:unnamed protein product [Mytilus edulis]
MVEKMNACALKLKLQKTKSEMKESLRNHQTIVDKNERMRSKIEALEQQKTEMKESLRVESIVPKFYQKEKDVEKMKIFYSRKKRKFQKCMKTLITGDKLTKGNPSFTDLGDPNRPIKISEKYGELYDNEWTDAMENVEVVKEYYHGLNVSEIEETVICHLHRLLKCCYKDCLTKTDEQMQTLGKALAETMCLTFNSEEVLSMPVCKEAWVFRRANSREYAKYLFENQDPVMYLDEDVPADTYIDKNTYTEFVKKGNTVAFVVWPALFLHKDGPLLYK